MGILDAIGNTDIIRLEKSGAEYGFDIYAKLEYLNPGGSIKDRTSLSMLQDAFEKKEIDEKTTIIESSSGNMAVGLAQFCLYHNLKLIIVVDPFALKSNIKLMKTYGAKVLQINEACPVTGWLGARIKKIKELLNELENAFWPNQYQNSSNPSAHFDTMKEFHLAMPAPLDFIFIPTSTCGTLMGCSQYIQKHGLSTKIIAVDAIGSVIFSGKSGDRKIPGHGASRPSYLLDKSKVHDVVHVSDLDCVNGCYRLLNSEAILAGGSTGGVYEAIAKYALKIPGGSNCGMMVSDRGERYMDTIYNEEWVSRNIISTFQKVDHAA